MYHGINKTIEADATGATATFHRIDYYAVDLRAKMTSLVITGYVSEAAFLAGKQSLLSSNVSFQVTPPAGVDVLTFAYETATAPAVVPDPSFPAAPHLSIFAGAELVPMPVPVDAPPVADAPANP